MTAPDPIRPWDLTLPATEPLDITWALNPLDPSQTEAPPPASAP
ncbi:hypothetical protein ACTU3I_13385 [Microbacterium sp. RD1]